MDDYGIRKAVISAPLGGGQEPSKEVLLASRLNEFSANMVRARPDRYAHFATIPLPDIDASLAEAAKALDTLGAVGVIVSTNYRGVYLGDPSFEPFWQELDRRKAVVFVHPTKPGYEIQGLPPGVLEFVFDTTRTVASLLFSGTTRRFPKIRFIFSHAGGTIPFVSSRLEGSARMNAEIAGRLPNGVLPELKRFYWDTALAFSEPAIKSLLAITDVSKVTFGSDYPFAPSQVFPIGLRSLNKEIPASALADVLHDSALRIMPGLA
jgi:predicted TIM-barrel fold metal-dependent hydrolase